MGDRREKRISAVEMTETVAAGRSAGKSAGVAQKEQNRDRKKRMKKASQRVDQKIKSVTQDLNHRGAQYTTPLDVLNAQQNRLPEEQKMQAEL